MDIKDAPAADEVCPFLGLRNDRDTRYGFANEGNHCHRERNPRTINLDYQENVCLNSGYLNCPIYLHSGGGVRPIPAKKSTHVIQGNGDGAASAQPSRQSPERTATAWTMLDDVEPAPESGSGRSLFSYGWFRLFFGLLLVVGSISGMLLLMQNTDLGGSGGSGASGGGAVVTPTLDDSGVLPVITDTEQIPTQTPFNPAEITATPPDTPTPTPTATLPPSQTATETASPTATSTPTATFIPYIPPTNTPVPPTNTLPPPTNTLAPPTNTPIPPTSTPVPPTATPPPPTDTPPPTETPISDVPTDTPEP